MPVSRFRDLACPLDGLPLVEEPGRLCCPNGHSFDIARQGYVNLLPVQHKKSRRPGDSQAMVDARGRFLDSGVYRPIAERVGDTAATLLAPGGPCGVLDAGCGEGYYLAHLVGRLGREPGGERLNAVGLDIAKPAIVSACRRSREITWLVASNARPPVMPGSMDLVTCLFGFPSWPAFAEVLKPGGAVLLVDPGPDHLAELRAVIYPEVRRRPPPPLDKAEAAGFRLAASDSLHYASGPLSRQQLDWLLTMTPHLYRASAEGRAAAAALDSLAVTVDVVLRTLVLDAAS